ncbi:MAG: hypothetical protein FJW36_05360 [Acidobacteria bacterium]|nr:hypothetical protein [Acidobacteriota bacterium]
MTTFSVLSSIWICGLSLAAQAQQSRVSGDSIAIDLRRGLPVVDSVYLEGKGPFRFLLDTGAESNQLDAALARRLGLAATFQVEMVTAGGVTQVPGARLPGVSLGSATASDQEFLFSDLKEMRRVSADIQGVLGQAFLSRFDYLLDYAGRRLVFGPASLEGGSRLDFTRVHGVPAIASSEGSLVLDSGSDTLVLFHKAAPIIGSGNGSQFFTHSGESSAVVLEDHRLKIAGEKYRVSKAAVVPQSSREEAGLLPVSLFRVVYFSNSKNYVVLNPKLACVAKNR